MLEFLFVVVVIGLVLLVTLGQLIRRKTYTHPGEKMFEGLPYDDDRR